MAAVLTGLVVLLFLGSGRSTLIVATSIPLSILCSILALAWCGQTINVMTLGGLALAVGILVDDATVMIENIDAHLETGLELEPAIIEAANQIVIPTFVSTLCICIVWLPLFQLSGVAGYLFLPLAEAIVFAMLASFILSRTLVPTMAAYLLPAPGCGTQGGRGAERPLRPVPSGVRATFRSVSRRLQGAAGQGGCAARPIHRRVPGGSSRLDRPAGALAGARFLPRYQVRRDRHAFPCADRAAPRGGRQGRVAGGHSHWHVAAGPRHQRHRQLRPADQRHQPGLQRERHDRTARLRRHHRPQRPGLAGRCVSRDSAR